MDNKNTTGQGRPTPSQTQQQGQVSFDRNRKPPAKKPAGKGGDSGRIYIVTAILCFLIVLVLVGIIVAVKNCDDRGPGGQTTTAPQAKSVTAPMPAVGASGDTLAFAASAEIAPDSPRLNLLSLRADPLRNANFNFHTIDAGNDSFLQTAAHAAFMEMMAAVARAEDGPKCDDFIVLATGAYRKTETNTGIISTGLAVRLNILDGPTYGPNDTAKAAEYAWLRANAHRFGWVWESNEATFVTYRYVGIPTATYMQTNNLTVAQYIAKLTENHKTFATALDIGGGHKAYFQPTGTANYTYVEGKTASVSSTTGGFIITLNP